KLALNGWGSDGRLRRMVPAAPGAHCGVAAATICGSIPSNDQGYFHNEAVWSHSSVPCYGGSGMGGPKDYGKPAGRDDALDAAGQEERQRIGQCAEAGGTERAAHPGQDE